MQQRWHRLPIVGRLLVATGIALLVAALVMVMITAREEASDIRSDLRHRLDQELETLPGTLAEAVVIGDFSTLQQMLDRYTTRPLVTEVQFRDIKGITLHSKNVLVTGSAPAWFLRLFGHDDVQGVASVTVGGREYGQLYLTLSPRPLADRAWAHLLKHMGILLLAIAINFIGTWMVLRLKPAGRPEVSEATEAFNEIAATVDANQSQLLQSEAQLRQHTLQLQPANATEAERKNVPTHLSGRILVVEDNPTNRKVVAAMLDRLGLQVMVAENGQQGLDAAMLDPGPDLILMDVQMPIMDGHTATRRIRAWESTEGRPRLPIIALTADAYEKDRKAAMAAGMDDFIAKPIDLNTLAHLLDRWLRTGKGSAVTPMQTATSAVSAEPTHVVFDEARMLDQIGGERTIARMMLQSAMQDMPPYLDRVEQAFQRADWKEVQHIVHSMKGLMFQIGALRIAEQFKAADKRLKAGERITIDQVHEWRGELAELIAALGNWLD